MRGADNMDGEVEVVLKGLGFRQEDLERRCEEFSGGWRMRIELAKILLARPDVFLLDEPTNHLDIQAKQSLKIALKEFKGTVLLVSHEPDFYKEWVQKIISIENIIKKR